MNWKFPKSDLPKIKEGSTSRRCLAKCIINKDVEQGTCLWTGFVDVFYDPCIGWMRCENETQVYVEKWVYIEEVENELDKR